MRSEELDVAGSLAAVAADLPGKERPFSRKYGKTRPTLSGGGRYKNRRVADVSSLGQHIASIDTLLRLLNLLRFVTVYIEGFSAVLMKSGDG